jgi:hypothetical protein
MAWDGNTCPYCNSSDLDTPYDHNHPNGYEQTRTCRACGRTFRMVYTAGYAEEIDREDARRGPDARTIGPRVNVGDNVLGLGVLPEYAAAMERDAAERPAAEAEPTTSEQMAGDGDPLQQPPQPQRSHAEQMGDGVTQDELAQLSSGAVDPDYISPAAATNPVAPESDIPPAVELAVQTGTLPPVVEGAHSGATGEALTDTRSEGEPAASTVGSEAMGPSSSPKGGVPTSAEADRVRENVTPPTPEAAAGTNPEPTSPPAPSE